MTNTLYFNGHILPMDGRTETPEALWVSNGQIRQSGALDALKNSVPPNTTFHDLSGKTLMPAFIDPHMHLWKVGDLLTYMLDLRGVGSIVEMQEKLADFARKHPERAWITARGFNEANMSEGRMPTRHDLDKVIRDRPVQVIRTCAHIAVLNTKGLESSGIYAHTPVPAGGEIRLDEHGQPNGIITETALGFPKKVMPTPGPEEYRTMILAAQEALLKAGIASVTDPAVHPELMDVYRMMEREGSLRVRVNAIPIRVPDGATTALALPDLIETDYLQVNTVKFFADGGLSGKTAALKRTYRGTNESGVMRLESDFFYQKALEAQSAGFRIATHAIGDRAIEQVLDVYEKLDKTNGKALRHRIEHLGLPESEHLKRMAALGIFCVSQPIFLWELGANFRQYLDADYLSRTYPYRSVLDAGVSLAFSSDAPVVRNFNPLTGIRNAIERCDMTGHAIAPDESISVREAFHAYTLGAAQANGYEKHTGSLEPGKLADMMILDRNPLETPTSELENIRIESLMTGQ
ncbi:MAG: amidohydrolase [Saprospiraceae bacterium]|nr:amidohydrolase [Saprospiraceae bacterium]